MYFRYNEVDYFVYPKEEVFEKAVQLLLPDLSKDDPRFAKIIEYAEMEYRHCRKGVVTLMRIDGAITRSLAKTSRFFKKLDLDPGKAEVIVSQNMIFYTADYKMAPTCIG